VKPTPISCAYAGTCRALAISWAYVPEVADLLLATLILGFCGALPCPMKVASMSLAEEPWMGGRGLLKIFKSGTYIHKPPHKKIPPS